jgi:hypothetical protein
MSRVMQRLLMVSIVAATWPLWGPFLRRVLAEIRSVAAEESEPAPPPPEGRGRHRRYVNSAWDDMHLGRCGATHVERRSGEGFVHRG